jgi:hypothetical protein
MKILCYKEACGVFHSKTSCSFWLVQCHGWCCTVMCTAVDKKTTAAQRSAAHKKPTEATPLFLLPQSGVIKLGHPGAAIKYRF